MRGKVDDWRGVTGLRLTVLGWEAGVLKGTAAGSLDWESPQLTGRHGTPPPSGHCCQLLGRLLSQV